MLALTAAVVGPIFIDWTAYRTQIEATAQRALGAEVSFTGEADVRLLPRPRVTIENVTLGPVDRPLMTARRVEMQIELTPLIKREIRIVDLTVEQPTVFARVAPSGRMELPDLAAERTIAAYFDVANVMIDRVAVSDATLVVVDERTGVRRMIDRVDLSGSARSLRGPFNVAGTVATGGTTSNITIAAGALTDGTIPVSARLAPQATPIAVTFEGALSPQSAAPGLAGAFALTSTSETVPWSIQGDMALDPVALRLGRATLTYGAGDTPLQLTGRATYNLTRSDPIAVVLEARQIDLDRVDRALREGDGPSIPADMLARVVGHLSPAVAGIAALPLPDHPLTADIDIGTLLAGGAVTRDVSLRLATGATGLEVERAEALFPGDTHVETTGRIAAEGYSGAVRVSASQPSIFAHWWSGDQFSGGIVDPILIEADIDVTAAAFDARRLSLRVGDSRANGSWRMRRTGERRRIDVSLGAPIVDVDDVLEAWAILPDRLIPSEGTDMTLDLTVGRILIGTVEGATLNVDASYADGTLQIDAIEAERLGGVSLFAVGQLGDLTGEPIGSINGTLEVLDGDALAASARQLFPLSPAARRFAGIAPHLAPGNLSFRIVGDTAPDAPGLAVSLEGTAGGTQVSFAAAGDLVGADWTQRPTTLTLRLANPDGTALAQQFGLVPPQAPGPGTVSLTLDGTPATGAEADLSASAFGTSVRYTGTVRTGETPSLDGHVSLAAEQVGPLATVTGVALPAIAGLTLEADVSTGDALELGALRGTVDGVAVSGALQVGRTAVGGTLKVATLDAAALTTLLLGPDAWTPADTGWPSAAFMRGGGPDLPISLAIEADSLVLGGNTVTDTAFTLDLASDRLTLTEARGTLAGGTASGSLRIDRSGAEARVFGSFALAGAQLAPLVWRVGEGPVAEGTLTLDSTFSTSGYTVADLVSGLDGAGTLAVADGRFDRFDPAPFDWDDDSGAAPDEARVRADFLDHLGAGDTRFEALRADVAIEGGVVRLRNVRFDPTLPLSVEAATVDLGAWLMRGDLALRTIVSGTPAVPIGVTFSGPLGAPQRSVDVSRLTTWAALRSIERQVEAVESDNEALKAEADAQSAPSSEALDRLGAGPTPAPPADPVAPPLEASPATGGPDGAPAPGTARQPADADAGPATVPSSPAEEIDPLAGEPDPDAPASPFPPIPAPSPQDARAPAGTPGAAADDTAAAAPATADPVGAYIRSVRELDSEMTAYEARRAERQRVADELQRTLGLGGADVAPRAPDRATEGTAPQ
nr:AsmA family protein [Acuticoccus sp. I52.16.1]